MGFEVPQNTMVLKFSDPSFSGLEVEALIVPLGEVSSAASLADVDPKNIKTEDVAKIDRLTEAFANALVRWNLTRNGEPVPATVEGFNSLDLTFAMQIVSAWLAGLGEILAAEANGDVDKSLEVTLPQEPL